MKKIFRKNLAALLVLLLILGCMPAMASAEGNTEAASLPELLTAIDNAEDGDTIILTADIQIDDAVTLGAADKHVTLTAPDSTNCNLTIGKYIPESKDVIIQNLTFASRPDDEAAPELSLVQEFPGTVRMNTVNFSDCVHSEGKHAYIINAGSAVLTDCEFTGGRSDYGAHIYQPLHGDLTLTHCTFTGAYSKYDGGALLSGSTLTMSDCTFTSNSAGSRGGAVSVSVQNQAAVSITGCTFTGNSGGYGGALFYGVHGMALTNCAFDSNQAKFKGGSLFCCDCQLTGTSITNCSAGEYGGAACLYTAAPSSLEGCTITNNSAGLEGGGINASGALSISTSKTYGNTAGNAGADLALVSGAALNISTTADEYTEMFAQEMEDGGYPLCAWFTDAASDRHKAGHETEIIDTPAEGLTTDEYLVFALYSPTPAPTLSPAPVISVPISGISVAPLPSPSPVPAEPEKEDPPALICGDAVIEPERISDFCAFYPQYIPQSKTITRGEAAAVIYGLLDDESRTIAVPSADAFCDIAASPYRQSVNRLAQAGAVVGCSKQEYSPENVLTWAQLITILARFTTTKESDVKNMNISGSWACSSVMTAVAAGWLDDAPLNLSTPVTAEKLVSFLARIAATVS